MEPRKWPEIEYELAVRRQADLHREARMMAMVPRARRGRIRGARIRLGRALVAAGVAIAGSSFVGSGAAARS